jgi:hypothetical protein
VKRLNTDGVEIAYLEQGKGPAVIIAHCSSASHKEWLPLIEELAPDCRVLAPDFIGYGQSDAWPENKVFTGQADLAVLLELAKKTKRPIHLVGHSYGAALALQIESSDQRCRVSSWSSRCPSSSCARNIGPNGPRSSGLASPYCRQCQAATSARPRQPSCAIGSVAVAGEIQSGNHHHHP